MRYSITTPIWIVWIVSSLGCASPVTTPVGQARITIAAPFTDLRVGEITVFTVTVINADHTRSEIRWTTTGGRLTTTMNGRNAQLTFEEPGVYELEARLIVDGRAIDTQRVTLDVEPAADPY